MAKAIMRSLSSHSPRVLSWLLASAGLAATIASCSNDAAPDMTGAGASSDSNEAGTLSRVGGEAGVGDNGNSGGSLNLGGSLAGSEAGAGAASVDANDACATSSQATQALPPVLELVVDTSGSMDWPPGWAPKSPDDSKPPGATKWEITRDALADAVAALPADTALGVSFYPNVEQSDQACLMTFQALPIAPLGATGSNSRAAWRAALADVIPVGATPTHGAYRFGLQQLTASTLPGDKFVLLITDGTPTCTIDCTCTENNEPVDSGPLLAEATAAFKDGVHTFVIGSPGSEGARDVLSQLASVGGTARLPCSDAGPDYCHFDMTTQADLAKGLTAALGEISTSIKSCEYPIPAPPAGEQLDPDRVNVLYTPKAGAKSETIARSSAAADDCSSGWQYSTDGASILLCGDDCTRAQSQSGTVDILFGCQTVIEPPR